MTEQSANWLSESEWDDAQRMVPIVCVDAVPIRRVWGRIEVGLIQRHNPFGPDPVWCQIGGRVRRDELLSAALHRHLADSLEGTDGPAAVDLQPVYVMQWLPGGPTAAAPWVGDDPRKHAISLCYPVSLTTEPRCRAGGEALAFAWFDHGKLADLPRLWPGTRQLVAAVVARASVRSRRGC